MADLEAMVFSNMTTKLGKVINTIAVLEGNTMVALILFSMPTAILTTLLVKNPPFVSLVAAFSFILTFKLQSYRP